MIVILKTCYALSTGWSYWLQVCTLESFVANQTTEHLET